MTEAEFVAERLKRHREECAGLDEDPLYAMARGTHAGTPVTEQERRAYCLGEGWMLRKQA